MKACWVDLKVILFENLYQINEWPIQAIKNAYLDMFDHQVLVNILHYIYTQSYPVYLYTGAGNHLFHWNTHSHLKIKIYHFECYRSYFSNEKFMSPIFFTKLLP